MRKHVLGKSLVFKNGFEFLRERYGSEAASVIWKDADSEFRRLEANHPDAEKRELTMVFPAIALYRAIEKNAPDDALEVTRAYGTKVGQKFSRILRKVTVVPGAPSLIWRNMPAIARRMSAGYKCEGVVVTDHLCSMHVVGCPVYYSAKRLGCPEAAQLICCIDKEYMVGLRGVNYTRTKSLAEGDGYCDYLMEDSRNKKKKQ